jgi:hypothetical protein
MVMRTRKEATHTKSSYIFGGLDGVDDVVGRMRKAGEIVHLLRLLPGLARLQLTSAQQLRTTATSPIPI